VVVGDFLYVHYAGQKVVVQVWDACVAGDTDCEINEDAELHSRLATSREERIRDLNDLSSPLSLTHHPLHKDIAASRASK